MNRSLDWQARAAAAKGAFMLLFGMGVLAEAVHKVLVPVMPDAEAMGVVGAAAFVANLACFVLLYRHRGDNINMSSTWLCSRNDLFANVGVLIAAGLGSILSSRWPDIVIGATIATLFLGSAVRVLRDAKAARHSGGAATHTLSPIR